MYVRVGFLRKKCTRGNGGGGGGREEWMAYHGERIFIKTKVVLAHVKGAKDGPTHLLDLLEQRAAVSLQTGILDWCMQSTCMKTKK